MADGAYSQRFRRLQKEHMEHCRKARLEENADLAARTQKLHAETARRCRSMAMKRKLHAQREEQHRQAILEKRRQEMQLVTDKFQRLGRRQVIGDYADVGDKSTTRISSTPTLEEALHVVLGRSRPSSAVVMNTSDRNVIKTRCNSAHTGRVIPTDEPDDWPLSAGDNGLWSAMQSSTTDKYRTIFPQGEQAVQRSDGTSMMTGVLINGANRKPANRWKQQQLLTTSAQDLATSRGMFEQKLNEHQQSLAARHQEALSEIGSAINDLAKNIESSEIIDSLDGSNSVAVRMNEKIMSASEGQVPSQTTSAIHQHPSGDCNYLSSQSSLEPSHQTESSSGTSNVIQPNENIASGQSSVVARGSQSVANSHLFGHGSDGNTNSAFFLHRSSGVTSPNVAVVQPSVHIVTSVHTVTSVSPLKQPCVDVTNTLVSCKFPSELQSAATGHLDVISPVASDSMEQSVHTAMPLKVAATKQLEAPLSALRTDTVIDVQVPLTNGPSVAPKSSLLDDLSKDAMCYDDVPVDDTSSVSSLMSDIGARSKPSASSVPKGILKKRPSSCTAASGSHPPALRTASAGLSRSGTMSSGSLRDSLEVTKSHLVASHLDTELKSGKKSVRFAEVLCQEEPHHLSSNLANSATPLTVPPTSNNFIFFPFPPQQQKPKESTGVRITRPVSAKVISSTPPVDPSVKMSRVASAGTLRRTPFYRPHPPHRTHPQGCGSSPPTQQASEVTAATLSSSSSAQPAANDAGNRLDDSTVFNGIRVDRTPTDEEINWLWEKVRTCLSNSRSNNVGSQPDNGNDNVAGPSVSQNNGAPNGLQPHRPTATTYVNNYMGSAMPLRRRKITMDTLSGFARRAGALVNDTGPQHPETRPPQGPRQETGPVQRPRQEIAVVPMSIQSSAVFNPRVMSAPLPGRTSVSNKQRNGVTESMAGFLAAETLCQTDVSDSTISRAMKVAEHRQHVANMYNNNNTQHHVPSALSIEEQCVLQSLERLDEKLKVNEMSVNHYNVIPRPPAANVGFRGHQLRVGPRRRIATLNGMVPGHYQPAQQQTNGYVHYDQQAIR